MTFRFCVHQDMLSDRTKLYLWGHDADYKSFCFTIRDGFLEQHPKDEGSGGEPFLELPRQLSEGVLQAMTEGLRNAGFVVEVDNAERVVAEALAKERKEENEVLRNKLFDIIDKVI